MTIAELYAKYAETDNGYTPIMPENGIFYFTEGTGLYYIDYVNNLTYHFYFNETQAATLGITLEDFIANITNYIQAGDKDSYSKLANDIINGNVVSTNDATKSVKIKDLATGDSHTVIIHDVPLSEWTVDGKRYYGYTNDLSSIDRFYTEDGDTEVTSVTPSAISFVIYKNNTSGINHITTPTNKVLDQSYYSITDNGDNTEILPIMKNSLLISY